MQHIKNALAFRLCFDLPDTPKNICHQINTDDLTMLFFIGLFKSEKIDSRKGATFVKYGQE